MSKRGELKNLSKIIEDVFSQKHFRIGIDNIRVQDAWVKTMHESNARKRAKFGKCEHDDFGWCETCLVTVEGERIVEV